MLPLESFNEFHFLRPGIFWLLIPAVIVIFLLIQTQKRALSPFHGLIAAHLQLALTLQPDNKSKKWWPTVSLALVILLIIVASAGPSWRMQTSPFLEDEAVTVVVIKVTDTMTSEDIQPSRLQRAVQKLEDLMSIREGAPHALIAYAGSAHLVMPFTYDKQAIMIFAKELTPEMMPNDGDNQQQAYRLAETLIRESSHAGNIVWLSDSNLTLSSEAMDHGKTSALFWLPITDNAISDQTKDVALRRIELTADNSDVTAIAKAVNKAWQNSGSLEGQRWQDNGYWLTPFIALIVLIWFRPGWRLDYDH